MYKEDLDMLRCPCGSPACEGPVFFHCRQHKEAPTWTSYYDGEIRVTCSECEGLIASIAVARNGRGNE